MDPITKLYHYYNTESNESTYYRIVEYVLTHIREIPTLSISSFADATFVSKATITRFCHFLGLDSYQDFKAYFEKSSHVSQLSFFKITGDQYQQLNREPAIFFKDYSDQIIASIQDTQATLDLLEVDKLIESVMNSPKVAILGYSDSLSIAKDIQLGCLLVKKIVTVPESEQKYLDVIQHFTENDLIIIISNYGNFFNHYHDYYQKILSKKIPLVLVTQNYASMDSFRFKQTIYLNSKRQLSVGNYPMRIFSEYFVRRLAHFEK